MNISEIEDILSDMVRCAPEESMDQREKLALHLSGLEDKIRQLENKLNSAANAASCLANGILPD